MELLLVQEFVPLLWRQHATIADAVAGALFVGLWALDLSMLSMLCRHRNLSSPLVLLLMPVPRHLFDEIVERRCAFHAPFVALKLL